MKVSTRGLSEKKGKPTTRNKTVKNIPYEERHKNDNINKNTDRRRGRKKST